jgi:hypothetical protein
MTLLFFFGWMYHTPPSVSVDPKSTLSPYELSNLMEPFEWPVAKMEWQEVVLGTVAIPKVEQDTSSVIGPVVVASVDASEERGRQPTIRAYLNGGILISSW